MQWSTQPRGLATDTFKISRHYIALNKIFHNSSLRVISVLNYYIHFSQNFVEVFKTKVKFTFIRNEK